jgi:hypothetical protein
LLTAYNYSVEDPEIQTEPECESFFLLPLRRFSDFDSLAIVHACVNNFPPQTILNISQRHSKIE